MVQVWIEVVAGGVIVLVVVFVVVFVRVFVAAVVAVVFELHVEEEE